MLLDGIRWALLWFIGYVAAHLVATRWLQPRLYFALAFRLFLIDALGLAITGAAFVSLRGAAWLNSLLIFGSLWVFYMVATFNVMRSVSVRTLVELSRSPSHALGEAALDRLYDTPSMFARRLESLVANGYLESADDRYQLTSRGRAFARAAYWTRRALNLRTYG
jgi:hypothetical protein